MPELLDLQKTAAILSLEFCGDKEQQHHNQDEMGFNAPFLEEQYFIHRSGMPIRLRAIEPVEPHVLTGLFAEESLRSYLRDHDGRRHSLIVPDPDPALPVNKCIEISQKFGETFVATKSEFWRDVMGNTISQDQQNLSPEELDEIIRDSFLGSLAFKGEEADLLSFLCLDKDSNLSMVRQIGRDLLRRTAQIEAGEAPVVPPVKIMLPNFDELTDGSDLTIGNDAHRVTPEILNKVPQGIFDLAEARQKARGSYIQQRDHFKQQAAKGEPVRDMFLNFIEHVESGGPETFGLVLG
ncbi:MAG: hypothetical protein ACXWLH_06195 [Candidatus Saccharimonadales bacterium]